MKIESIDGFIAQCTAKGVEREVNLFLLQHEEVRPGDYVIVHLGNATQVIPEEDALKSWDLFDEILNVTR